MNKKLIKTRDLLNGICNVGVIMVKKKVIIALVILFICLHNNLTANGEELDGAFVEEEQISFDVQMDHMYTYENMIQDILTLQYLHPDIICCYPIATTPDNRVIPVIVLGNKESEHNIMVQAAIHGREYGTTQVVMKMVEYYAELYTGAPTDLLYNTCFYIVPMSNPDGVFIAQSRECLWKANGSGVDLNRNFDIQWDNINTKGVYAPASENFKGYTPASEIEVKSLIQLATERNYDCYISYHQKGNIIYYHDNVIPETLRTSTELAKTIQSINGYKLVSLRNSNRMGETTLGGFTDWIQFVMNKPAVTIECGTACPPFGQGQVNSIYEKNKNTWLAIAGIYN